MIFHSFSGLAVYSGFAQMNATLHVRFSSLAVVCVSSPLEKGVCVWFRLPISLPHPSPFFLMLEIELRASYLLDLLSSYILSSLWRVGSGRGGSHVVQASFKLAGIRNTHRHAWFLMYFIHTTFHSLHTRLFFPS